jgi:cardiolipin synthase (CMP-forming)
MNIAIHIPNGLTIARGLLAPLVAVLLARHDFRAALWCFAAAGATDWMDGFVARTFGLSTRLGSFLDPAADKLLMVVSFLVLGWMGLLPGWLVVLVILRDLVIVAGAVAYWRYSGTFAMAPLLVSKLNTLGQIILVVGSVAAAAGIIPPGQWTEWLQVTVAVTTSVSGFRYVWVWTKKSLDLRNRGAAAPPPR